MATKETRQRISNNEHKFAVMDAVHAFEHRFGDTPIEDIPENDPIVKRMRKLLNSSKTNNYPQHRYPIKIKPSRKELIKKMLNDGYGRDQIMQKLDITLPVLVKTMKLLNMKTKSQFRYMYQSIIPSKPDIYMTSKNAIFKVFGTTRKDVIDSMGYKVKQIRSDRPIIWANVPDRAIYVIRTACEVYVKDGYFNYGKKDGTEEDILNAIRMHS